VSVVFPTFKLDCLIHLLRNSGVSVPNYDNFIIVLHVFIEMMTPIKII
jgi:hypothetical protein